MKRSLIQIAQDAAALEEILQEDAGELSVALEAWLDEVEKNVATKVDHYSVVLDVIGDTARRYRERAEAYRAAAKAAENVAERMKDRIHVAMQIMNVQVLEGQDIRFKEQKSPPSLVFTGLVTDLPSQYQVIEVSADTPKIKAALKDGIEVPGCRLEQGTHIRKYLKAAK